MKPIWGSDILVRQGHHRPMRPKCNHCGKNHDRYYSHKVNGRILCENCYKKYMDNINPKTVKGTKEELEIMKNAYKGLDNVGRNVKL